jgi:hypothetical protein
LKNLKATLFLCLLTLSAIACAKQATQNTNTQAAKPANANTASTAAPKSAAPKTAATPVSTTPEGDNVYTSAEGGIQFEVPPTWKTEIEGEVIKISTPDDVLNISLWVHKEGDIEEASQEIGKELAKVMTNIEMGKEQENTLNGMKVYSVTGTGDIEGTKVQWSVDVIEAKKPVFALSFAAPNLWEKHQKEFKAFVNSIKKTS